MYHRVSPALPIAHLPTTQTLSLSAVLDHHRYWRVSPACPPCCCLGLRKVQASLCHKPFTLAPGGNSRQMEKAIKQEHFFFLPVASFILGNCTHHQRGHTQDPEARSQLPPPNRGRASNTPERHSAFISILSGNQAKNKCAVCVI